MKPSTLIAIDVEGIALWILDAIGFTCIEGQPFCRSGDIVLAVSVSAGTLCLGPRNCKRRNVAQRKEAANTRASTGEQASGEVGELES